MRPDFHDFMSEATRLTRAGEVGRATALIQSALSGRAFAAAAGAAPFARAADDDVIDVEARFVPDVPELACPSTAEDVAERPGRGGATADAPSIVRGRFGQGRAARDYWLYVPPCNGAQIDSRPLVVMLHGCTQDAADFARGTRMDELALEHGFLVLYPDQSRQANPQGCWNWFKPSHQSRGRGEPETLAGMVREVIAKYGVDATRVYVAGLSAGGAMAAIVGQAYPDLFAAIGVHSGLAPGAAKDLPSALGAMKGQRPTITGALGVPTIVFHGDADATVHPRNGQSIFDAAPGGLREEAIDVDTSQVPGRRPARRVRRLDAEGRVVAEQWTIGGAPHAWSGGSPTGSYTDPSGPDASREMVRFFLSHAIRSEP